MATRRVVGKSSIRVGDEHVLRFVCGPTFNICCSVDETNAAETLSECDITFVIKNGVVLVTIALTSRAEMPPSVNNYSTLQGWLQLSDCQSR